MPRLTRRGSRPSRGLPARRRWVWARHNLTVSVPTATANFRDLLEEFEDAYGAQLIGSTLIRMRGEIKTDQSIVVGARVYTEPVDGIAGMTITNEGLRALPYADWFYYKPMFLDETTGVRVMEVDVKSSRRIEEVNQSLLLVVENLSGATATVSWDLSMGIKLP